MDAKEKRAMELLATTNLFLTEIASRCGIPRSRVYRMRRRYGLRQLTEEERLSIEAEEAYKKLATAKLLAGATLRAVVEETGLSSGVIVAIVRSLGIEESRPLRFSYVYALGSPLDKLLYYVGVSVNPWMRSRQHELRGPAAAWIASLGRSPDLHLLEDVPPENNREAREQHWIRAMLAHGHPLINVHHAKPLAS